MSLDKKHFLPLEMASIFDMASSFTCSLHVLARQPRGLDAKVFVLTNLGPLSIGRCHVSARVARPSPYQPTAPYPARRESTPTTDILQRATAVNLVSVCRRRAPESTTSVATRQRPKD